MAIYEIFGPLDTMVGPWITELVLVLAVLNAGTRWRAHRRHRNQAADGAESLDRDRLHMLSNVLLLLASFYYLSIHPHGGMVMSVLVVTLIVTDLFEFESRLVEVRGEFDLDPPRAAVAASVLVIGYAAYASLFFVVKPIWSAIV
jgi:hypothetical protein